jgi:predicted transcriptional regulator
MTEQYKVRLDENVIKRLDQIAQRYGRRSGNMVAAEVIEQYLDFWENAEQAKVAVLEQQRAALLAPATGTRTVRKRA